MVKQFNILKYDRKYETYKLYKLAPNDRNIYTMIVSKKRDQPSKSFTSIYSWLHTTQLLKKKKRKKNFTITDVEVVTF